MTAPQPIAALEPAPRRRAWSLRAALGALVGAIVLMTTAVAWGDAPVAADTGAESATPSETAPTEVAPPTTESPAPSAETPAVQGQGVPPTAPGASSGEGASGSPAAPEVRAQRPQASTRGALPAAGAHHRSHAREGLAGGGAANAPRAKHPAPLPSALTPPLPGALGSPIAGIPSFFIESFRIPPFLLPIYQAAGTAYGIPWEVLAAINEVETDYGRDLSVSSAGAEGWMQFLPSSWLTYGVDANGDGFMDPYNPADAIFAAARYLAAAGGTHDIRAAVYSYNHSQTYVDSVMLRAQLLQGTPPELLAAITGLTESRFPVHAPAHFTDGFTTTTAAPASAPGSSTTLAGTTIYSQAGAPVIAVQDGRVTAIGDTPTLGRYVSLRDAYGNTYTYAQLGSVASLYPVLEPRDHSGVSPRISKPGAAAGPRPSEPASAGVQPRSPLTESAISSSLALGAAAGLETAPTPVAPTPPPALPAPPPASVPHAFRAGPDEVYLHGLRPGVQVLAGTVLGHLESATEVAAPAGSTASAAPPEAHMLFQIRPAGEGAPLIDPKPILDGWVRLEDTSIFRAKGENPFLATSPTVGEVLLETKPQLEQQVLRDPGVRFAAACERGEVQAGQVDRRVLAALEFLSVSGLRPTVSALRCARAAAASAANGADAVEISAINGIPIAGHEGADSIADLTVHRLLRLQGTMKPRRIVSALSFPGSDNTFAFPGRRGVIEIGFTAAGGARAARAAEATGLSPDQWLQLVSRLGEIPDPAVAGKPSAAAIPDNAAGGQPASGAASDGSGG